MGPKILILDIETSPSLVYMWSLHVQGYVSPDFIQQDWSVIACAAKWIDQREVFYWDLRGVKDINDDKKILREVWKLMDEADVIVTQNGKSFDEKKLNARFIIQGFQPPSPYKHIDTKQIVKRKFGFTSNSLKYLARVLGLAEQKSEHESFVGFELWRACMRGDQKAWREMEKYNKQDVVTTEELYKKLRPWDRSLNPNLYHDGNHTVCTCGGTMFINTGYYLTTTGRVNKMKCKACGHPWKDRHNQFDTMKKLTLKVPIK